jgi:hypothetical protein
MQIEVSTGEIVDKFTILTIKKANIKEEDKLHNVEKELNYLSGVLLELGIPNDESLLTDLIKVNKNLWDVEDRLRNCERDRLFDEHFVQLARSVYRLNDKRAHVKKEINLKYGSDFVEEKSYTPY